MEIISSKRCLRQRLLEMPPSALRAKKGGRNNVFCSFFRPLNQNFLNQHCQPHGLSLVKQR